MKWKQRIRLLVKFKPFYLYFKSKSMERMVNKMWLDWHFFLIGKRNDFDCEASSQQRLYLLLYALFKTSFVNASNSGFTCGSFTFIGTIPVPLSMAACISSLTDSWVKIFRSSRSTFVPHTNDEWICEPVGIKRWYPYHKWLKYFISLFWMLHCLNCHTWIFIRNSHLKFHEKKLKTFCIQLTILYFVGCFDAIARFSRLFAFNKNSRGWNVSLLHLFVLWFSKEDATLLTAPERMPINSQTILTANKMHSSNADVLNAKFELNELFSTVKNVQTRAIPVIGQPIVTPNFLFFPALIVTRKCSFNALCFWF